MPILIKDFTWTQTDSHIRITVPLKNARARAHQVDVFIQPAFVKINAPPHIFEAYLEHDIAADDCSAYATDLGTTRLLEHEIRLQLRKAETGLQWQALCRPVGSAETVEHKRRIVAAAHELAAAEDTRRHERRVAARSADIQQEIDREGRIRAQVEALNRAAVSLELQAVNEMKAPPPPPLTLTRAIEPPKTKVEKEQKPVAAPPTTPPFRPKPQPPAEPVIPAVRQAATIDCEFSARRFPTPQRESLAAQEQEWLQRQDEARRAIGFMEEDLRPEERNPDWLRAKGAEFYAKRNYLAAISAFSTAIRMAPKCYDLYMNRASCQYAVENWNRCVTDCSEALELLQPACPSNARARAQCMVKRGAALCKLGRLLNGRDELQQAAYLQPDDEEIRRDLATAQQALEDASDEE